MIELRAGRWYGWQMMPGYSDGPYFSPIRIETVHRSTAHCKIIDLRFLNALYASGVQTFEKRLHVLLATKTYMAARLDRDFASDRMVVINKMSQGWLEACCPRIWAQLADRASDREMEAALDGLFRSRPDRSSV